MKIKLYTQEQVLDAIEKSEIGYSGSQIIESLTPIELPSDEEIAENSEKGYVKLDGNRILNWINGAKWMRDKILNQNK